MSKKPDHHFLSEHSLLVPFNEKFKLSKYKTKIKGNNNKEKNKEALHKSVEKLAELQRVLYAHDKYAVLCVFQAMDAAGKDSTIRAVFSGVNPAGFQVYNFKKPSEEALDHDFLWKAARRLPERGRIGVFNRSYYEEVLIVRVHDKILKSQKIPTDLFDDDIWTHRFESIRAHEHHLARNGMVVIKFFLHLSKEEQKKRFLSRLDTPEKNWKFEPADVRERLYWNDYQKAYDEMLRETSRPYAPWYVIPADDKPTMRAMVADIIVQTLEGLPIHYPEVSESSQKEFAELRQILENEDS